MKNDEVAYFFPKVEKFWHPKCRTWASTLRLSNVSHQPASLPAFYPQPSALQLLHHFSIKKQKWGRVWEGGASEPFKYHWNSLLFWHGPRERCVEQCMVHLPLHRLQNLSFAYNKTCFSEQDAIPYLVASTKSSEMSKWHTFFWKKCVGFDENQANTYRKRITKRAFLSRTHFLTW